MSPLCSGKVGGTGEGRAPLSLRWSRSLNPRDHLHAPVPDKWTIETDFLLKGLTTVRGEGGGVGGSDLTTRTGSQRPKTHFLYFCPFFKKP